MGRVVSFESAHSWYVSFPVYFPWPPSLGIIPSAVLHSFFQRLVASARNWVIFPIPRCRPPVSTGTTPQATATFNRLMQNDEATVI